MTKSSKNDYVAWYILALFDFGVPISNLSDRQLEELWEKILIALKKQLPKKEFFVNGEIKEIEMPHEDESFKLATVEPYTSYVKLLRSPLFGFYNRRMIIRLTIEKKDFFELRSIREDILRDLKYVFEDLKGIKLTAVDTKVIGEKPWELEDIFFYPLIIVRNGKHIIDDEYKTAKLNKIDPIFSIPNTSLTYTLPERGKWFNFFSFKEHYIRVSVRSVMIFCDGWIPLEFKQSIINAIFIGGLYEQMEKIRCGEEPQTRQRMRAIDDDILLNLGDTIREMIKANIEAARIAEKQRFISFFISTLSFLISVFAFILSLITIYR